MSIAIGRAGRDTNLPLNSPAYWNVNGDTVEAGGALTATSYAKLVLLREQVNGLTDNRDEPIVAVTWPGDASRDGYYQVLDAAVPMPPRGLAALKLDWRVRLRRVAAYPDITSLLVGSAVRTNAHAIAKGSTAPWWAVPDAATMDYIPSASAATRTTDTGAVTIWYRTDGTVLYDRSCRWQCPASDYYDGACRIELWDGTAYGWYALVGRRIPNTAATYGWRLTNGLVRVSWGSGDGLLLVEHYVAGAWSVAKTYKLTVTTTPTTIGAFRTVTVKRNSPAFAHIRLGLDQSNGAVPAAVTVDLMLRRGALWVEGVMARTPEMVAYAANEMGVYRNSAEAATAHTGGIHATTADATGGLGKYLLNTSLAKTNDLTQGGFYAGTGVDQLDFQIGYEPPTPATINDFTRQTYSYFGPVDEVVGFARR